MDPGIPARRGIFSPFEIFSSIASAWERALSSEIVIKALSEGFCSFARARYSEVSSFAEIAFEMSLLWSSLIFEDMRSDNAR